MGQDKKLTEKRLSKLWENTGIEVLETKGEKYAIMSDLHMGDGGAADDLRSNAETLIRALDYYYKNNFKLILLGDIEEFWQFNLEQIKNKYNESIYSALRNFGINRIYRVYGNHDLAWQLKDPLKEDESEVYWPVEALKMKVNGGKPGILLVHGHQGSTHCDKNTWISRMYIKHIWKLVEIIAGKLKLNNHPSATKSQIIKSYEQILYAWAKKTKVIVICGHSHRAIYASKSYVTALQDRIRFLESDIQKHPHDIKRIKKNRRLMKLLNKKLAEEKKRGRDIDPAQKDRAPVPCYFNCGCALYRNGITLLEIIDNKIRLVKWHNKPESGQLFEVYNDGDEMTISDFLKKTRA